MPSNSIFHSSSDEKSWVVHITEIFESLDHEIQSIHVGVFHVPKSLSSAKPEDYVPQFVALGPYHHFRPELYPMERFKLIAAKRVLNLFKNIQLSQLISELEKLGPYIRACYHKYLDLKDDTLACIIAIDSLFFLDLLHGYAKIQKNGEPMSHLVHTSGVKLTKDAILRDVLMLENQIPLVVLRKIFTIICSKPESVDEAVNSMLMSFCHALTPLPLDQNCSSQVVLNHAHLLDLMYHLILQERYPEPCEAKGNDHTNNVTRDQPSNTSSPSPSVFPCRKTITGPLHFFKKKVLDPVLNYFGKLYGQMEGIGFLKPIKGPINLVLKLSNKLPLASLSNSDSDVAPVVVTIPSVTQLHAVGIKFRPASGGIRTIRFDGKTGTFYLPKVTLDVNSEVIMRNLVAYEAMTKSEFLLFTRYTELMRAIVDTVEDIEVLVEKKIVVSHLDDNEVEKVFNGMSKSIGPTKTPILDETIEKVNKYYNGTQKVKRYRLLKKYVYSSWKICTLFATLLLLALISLQSFCSVYDCPRIFKTDQEIA